MNVFKDSTLLWSLRLALLNSETQDLNAFICLAVLLELYPTESNGNLPILLSDYIY